MQGLLTSGSAVDSTALRALQNQMMANHQQHEASLDALQARLSAVQPPEPLETRTYHRQSHPSSSDPNALQALQTQMMTHHHQHEASLAALQAQNAVLQQRLLQQDGAMQQQSVAMQKMLEEKFEGKLQSLLSAAPSSLPLSPPPRPAMPTREHCQPMSHPTAPRVFDRGIEASQWMPHASAPPAVPPCAATPRQPLWPQQSDWRAESERAVEAMQRFKGLEDYFRPHPQFR